MIIRTWSFPCGRVWKKDRDDVIKKLIEIQYDRNDMDFKRGTFRVKGDVVDIFPAYSDSEATGLNFSVMR